MILLKPTGVLSKECWIELDLALVLIEFDFKSINSFADTDTFILANSQRHRPIRF